MKITTRQAAGFSLAEALIAIAIFALLSVSIVTLALGSFNGLARSDKTSTAAALADQGVAAVRSLAVNNWSALNLQTSGLTLNGGQWSLLGEGSFDEQGGFKRQLFFSAVCRDKNTDKLVTCPEGWLDASARRARVVVSWEQNGVEQKTEREVLVNNQLEAVEARIACAEPPANGQYTTSTFYGLYDTDADGQLSGAELEPLCATGTASHLLADYEWSWQCGRSRCQAVLLATGTIPSTSVKLADQGSNTGSGRVLARDSNDYWYAVYVDNGQAYYRRSQDNGLSWDLPTLITADTNVVSISVATDNLNQVHFVWSAGTAGNRSVSYRQLSAGSWSAVKTISTNSQGDQLNPVIAIDAANNAYIAWQGADNNSAGYQQIRYAKVSNGTVSAVTTVTSGASHKENPSLVTDEANQLHLAWSGYQGTYRQIYYRDYSNNRWRAEVVLTNGNWQQLDPVLAIDSDGNPILVWSGQLADGLYQIRFSRRLGNSWQTPATLTNESYNQTKPSLAVSSQGVIDVFWQGASANHPGQETIRQRRLTAGTWQSIKDSNINGQQPKAITAIYGSNNQLTAGWAYSYQAAGAVYFEAGQ